jgi:hypothetical protein
MVSNFANFSERALIWQWNQSVLQAGEVVMRSRADQFVGAIVGGEGSGSEEMPSDRH